MNHRQHQHELFMDFSGLVQPSGARPSDIDLFYVCKDGFLILGEIKNEMGEFKPGQRRLYQKLADGYNKGAMVLYITHDKRIENGDNIVDISQCYVKEYYYDGEWRVPQNPITVAKVISMQESWGE